MNPIKCVYNADLKKEIYNFHMYLSCATGNCHMFPTSIIQFSWTSVAGSESFLKYIFCNLRMNLYQRLRVNFKKAQVFLAMLVSLNSYHLLCMASDSLFFPSFSMWLNLEIQFYICLGFFTSIVSKTDSYLVAICLLTVFF